MDEGNGLVSPANEDTAEIIESRLANFWLRIIALVIDVAVLFVIAFLVGSIFGRYLTQIGYYSKFVGLLLILLYYGLLQSCLGQGQTLGQRSCHITVVNREGECISPARAVCRTAILWSPLFFAHFILPVNNLYVLLNYILVIPLSIAIIYLYLFNRKTRQSLHDLLCGTFVIKDTHTAAIWRQYVPDSHAAPIWPWTVAVSRTHFIILPILIVLSLLRTPFTSLAAVLNNAQGAQVIEIRDTLMLGASKYKGHMLSVFAESKHNTPDEQLVAPLGKALFLYCPQAENYAAVSLVFSSGYDLLIYKSTQNNVWVDTPQQLQRRLNILPDK